MIDLKPTLSIIITSYSMNILNYALDLLESIKAQTYSNIEVIYVAERSQELFNRLKTYATENPDFNMKVVFNNGESGLSSARNIGIENAQGQIISFIDDDALPFPDWAEEMVKTYDDVNVVAVTGPALPLWDKSNLWFPEELYWIIGCTAWSQWDQKREVRNVWGMNMSFKKEALDLAGSFSTSIGGIHGKRLHGEEDELSLRVRKITKKSIVYTPKVKVKHRVSERRLTVKFIARNSYWIGRSRHTLKDLYHEGDDDKKLLQVEYRLLNRILTKLFPNIFKTFFTRPVIAWHKFRVTFVALLFVALGYCPPYFTRILHKPTRKYS